MKKFYLYKANFYTTVFGFSFIEEAIDDFFKSDYTDFDEVEIYSYKATYSGTNEDIKDLKLVISANEMTKFFQGVTKEKNRLIKAIVKKHENK